VGGWEACLPFSFDFRQQLKEEFVEEAAATGSDDSGGGGIQTVLNVAQFEEVLVVSAVKLSGFFNAG
jgi:hypothetical protein